MLQCDAVCCSELQCVVMCCNERGENQIWRRYQTCGCIAVLCVAVCCSVLQCVAVCCSVLKCVAVCCSVLQCVVVKQANQIWRRYQTCGFDRRQARRR